MIDQWLSLHWAIASAPTLVISGVRKIVGDISWQIPGSALKTDLTFEDLGYTTKGKFGQLKRNYWNQESVDIAVKKLLSRKDSVHASSAIRLQAGDKDSRSSGYCMQNMVITICGDKSFVDIYYRSTEVSMKFLADLIFFCKVLPPIFEELGIEPELIRFKFANAFISALYQPVFLRFEQNPVGFYKHLQKHDPRFFRTYSLASSKYLKEEHSYTYRMRIRMFEYTKQWVSQDKLNSLKPFFVGLRGEITDDEEDDE